MAEKRFASARASLAKQLSATAGGGTADGGGFGARGGVGVVTVGNFAITPGMRLQLYRNAAELQPGQLTHHKHRETAPLQVRREHRQPTNNWHSFNVVEQIAEKRQRPAIGGVAGAKQNLVEIGCPPPRPIHLARLRGFLLASHFTKGIGLDHNTQRP